jgi:hypothetical protein
MDKVAVAPVGRFGRPRGRGTAGRRRRSLLGLGGTCLPILLRLSACSAGQVTLDVPVAAPRAPAP